MSDSKRHWKESIGVVTPSRPAKPPGTSSAAPTTAAPRAPLPAQPNSAKTGAGDGAASPRTSTPATQTAPLPVKTAPHQAKPAPATITRPISSGEITNAQLGIVPVEAAIDALPTGSLTFGEQVATHLWQNPSPQELRALSVIATGKHRLAQGPLREAVVRAVAVCQRYRRLLVTPLVGPIDGARLLALASECERLATLTRQTIADWPGVRGEDPELEVLKAGRSLLPDPLLPEAHAALWAEIARLTDALAQGGTTGVASWNAPVAEVEPVLASLRQRDVQKGEGFYVQLFAGCLLAQRDLSGGDRTALERDRALMQSLFDKLEFIVNAEVAAHRRDATRGARLAAWRRFLLETRGRVDEALTRPDGASATGPATPLPRTGAVETTAMPGNPAPAPAAPADQGIVWHLRKLRAEAEAEKSGPNDKPAERTGWRRWLFFGSLITLCLVVCGFWLTLPRAVPKSIQVSTADFDDAVSLSQATSAGSLLIAVADPGWEQMDATARRTGATRLMTQAERKGLHAGLLIGSDGTPLASWSPGQEPALRRAPGTATAQAALRQTGQPGR